MSFPGLIWMNLVRHRIRALIGSAGIAFGVAAMLTVLSIVLGAISMFERILSEDTHFLVFERNVSDLFFSSVSDESVRAIAGLGWVESANPMLFGIVSSPDRPVITCFGISPNDPRLDRAEWLGGVRSLFGTEEDTVYLGSRAAGFLNTSAGQKVQIGKGEFRVGGILRLSNGFEDGGVFMPLETAQAFFHREGYSSIIAVRLKDRDEGAAFRRAVDGRFPDLIALPNEEFSQSYSQFKILSATAWAVGICAFMLGGLGVANTMLMSVFGRIREIAILRVTGFSKIQVALMILGESLVLALVGALAGFGLGFAALMGMQEVPQLNGYVQPLIDPLVLSGVLLVAFVTSIAGSFYPAWYATRIQPAEALRYE